MLRSCFPACSVTCFKNPLPRRCSPVSLPLFHLLHSHPQPTPHPCLIPFSHLLPCGPSSACIPPLLPTPLPLPPSPSLPPAPLWPILICRLGSSTPPLLPPFPLPSSHLLPSMPQPIPNPSPPPSSHLLPCGPSPSPGQAPAPLPSSNPSPSPLPPSTPLTCSPVAHPHLQVRLQQPINEIPALVAHDLGVIRPRDAPVQNILKDLLGGVGVEGRHTCSTKRRGSSQGSSW